MASGRSSPQNHVRRQSIPLQDLSRPPDPIVSRSGGSERPRSVSGRARDFLSSRHSFSERLNTAYARVDEGSPSAHNRNLLDLPHVTTPRSAHQPLYNLDDGEVSPINGRAYQDAVGSVGISFEPAGPSISPTPGSASAARANTLGVIQETDAASPFSNSLNHLPIDDHNENYSFTVTDDSTPLTLNLEPISGAQSTQSSAQRHDRQNSLSVLSSRLGDDLPNLEGNLRASRLSTHSGRSITRTLSTSSAASPLSRAGSMVRKMSQRVVNLSNEPEIIEQSIRRQPSSKQARLEEPPSFPAFTEYAHDEPQRIVPPIEKVAPLIITHQSQEEDPKPHNPLKGKSLFVFSPENWIRLKLCEMLVHPATEPVILVLIVLQTILLAVDSAPTLEQGQRPKTWGDSRIDAATLVLFAIYSIEIAARIIVSGLIMNADEYSTINWSLGFKGAITDKARNLFAPQRQQPTSNPLNPMSAAGPQPSILRSFTSMQAQTDQTGSSRQQQRNRLARRAFLRHSFNRLDFLAVISYWVSFALAVSHVEANSHFYVFRMLSCLRILRLLSLTTGTSVSGLIRFYFTSLLLMLTTFVGYSTKFEKGGSFTGKCGLLDWLFLAPLCHNRGSKLQGFVSTHVLLV